MGNEKTLSVGIDLLTELDLTDSESVQINRTKYGDGSYDVEVSVSFPAKDDLEEISFKPEISI